MNSSILKLLPYDVQNQDTNDDKPQPEFRGQVSEPLHQGHTECLLQSEMRQSFVVLLTVRWHAWHLPSTHVWQALFSRPSIQAQVYGGQRCCVTVTPSVDVTIVSNS